LPPEKRFPGQSWGAPGGEGGSDYLKLRGRLPLPSMIGTHATQQEISNIKPEPQKHIAFQVWAIGFAC